jgi:hypothetical protein
MHLVLVLSHGIAQRPASNHIALTTKLRKTTEVLKMKEVV